MRTVALRRAAVASLFAMPVLLTSAVPVIAVPGSAAAADEPLTVTACDPNTTAPGAPPTVDVDPAWFAGGHTVALMNNSGGRNPHLASAPPGGTPFGGTPLCVTELGPDGTPNPPRWMFCLDHGVPACGEDQYKEGGRNGGRKELTETERARIAYILSDMADYSTATTRGLAAQYVWCVTEGKEAGAEVPDPNLYPGARCPDWRDVDRKASAAAALTVTGADAAVAGEEQRLTVNTTERELQVTTTGLSGPPRLCPGTTGATLAADGRLTLEEGTDRVELCVTRARSGSADVKVTAVAAAREPRFWVTASGRADCQGFVDQIPREVRLEDAATVRWVAPAADPSPAVSSGEATTRPDPVSSPAPSSAAPSSAAPSSAAPSPAVTSPAVVRPTPSASAAGPLPQGRPPGGELAATGSDHTLLVGGLAALLTLGGATLVGRRRSGKG